LAGYGDTPVTLFEKCLAGRKLHTAILYLPLMDPHLDAARGKQASSLAKDLQDLRLVHSMALRLLWDCLRRGRKEWKMVRASLPSEGVGLPTDPLRV
jgi:hypothetical protein